MKVGLFILWGALFLVTACQNSSETSFSGEMGFSGGTEFGNGSELFGGSIHAFSGRSKVSYCVQKESKTPMDFDSRRKLVKEVIVKWDRYLVDKRLNISDLSIPFEESALCENVDVVFAIGADDSLIQELKLRHRKPLAFADFVQQTNQWVVWVSPELNRQEHIFAELLHEVGHLYGNEHVPNTIMRVDLANVIERLDPKFYTSIDHQDELVTCANCQFSCEFDSVDSLGLERLVGHQVKGPVQAAFTRIPKSHPYETLPIGGPSFRFSIPDTFGFMFISNGPETMASFSFGDWEWRQQSGLTAFKVRKPNGDTIGTPVGKTAWLMKLKTNLPNEDEVLLSVSPLADKNYLFEIGYEKTPLGTCASRP